MRKKTNAWYKEGRKFVRARGGPRGRPEPRQGSTQRDPAYAGTPPPRKPGPPGTLSIAVVYKITPTRKTIWAESRQSETQPQPRTEPPPQPHTYHLLSPSPKNRCMKHIPHCTVQWSISQYSYIPNTVNYFRQNAKRARKWQRVRFYSASAWAPKLCGRSKNAAWSACFCRGVKPPSPAACALSGRDE